MRSLTFLRIAAVAAFALSAGFVPGARAFTIQVDSSGTPIQAWASSQIAVDYNFKDCLAAGTSQASLEEALDAALAAWNSVPGSSLKLVRGGAVTTTAAAITSQTTAGNPLVLCDASLSTDLAKPDEQPVNVSNIPAVTRLLRVDEEGHIALAVLFLNADTGSAANVNHLARIPGLLSIILAHELGHVTGLGHTSDPNSLMYYDATDKVSLSLSQDDMNGVAYLYPRRELLGSGLFGCGTLRKGGPGPGGGGGREALEWFALLLSCLGATWLGKRAGRNQPEPMPV